MYLWVKIFHGVEYPDTSWYQSCFLVDFIGSCGGYIQNVGVLDNSSFQLLERVRMC